MEFRLRNRARLRRKEIEELAARVAAELGTKTMFVETDPVERAEAEGADYLLLREDVVGFYHEGKPFLSLRGILKYGASKRFVTVDMGAVPFVTNGADVMGPGIRDADPSIQPGDLVWVREERHGKPLAVGVALADAATLKAKTKGKQVKTLQFVGDRVWTWGHEEPEKPEAEAADEPS